MWPDLLLFLAAFSPVSAGNDAALRELRAEYGRLSEAWAEGDIDSILAFQAPNYASIAPNGQYRNKAYNEQSLRLSFQTNRPPYRLRNTIRCARFPARDRAVLVIFQQFSRSQEMAGAWRRVDSDVTQRELWRRYPGGWRLELVDSIHDPHRWIDGKPVDPSVRYHPDVAPFSPAVKAARPCAELLAD